jgi:hypothetical protein
MKEFIVQEIHYEHEEEGVEPPPLDLIPNFETLENWLHHICDTEQPEKPIATYHFGVFESPEGYSVFLIGRNTYEKGQNHSISTIDFEPLNMYFKMTKSEFENRTGEQVKEQLITQLKDFTMTDKFRQSFFTKANAIFTEFNGEKIWSK